MRLFVILFIFVFNSFHSVFAIQPEPTQIEAINVGEEETLILLSNKTLWKYKHWENIWETVYTPNEWQVGDVVHIGYHSVNRYYVLIKEEFIDTWVPFTKRVWVSLMNHDDPDLQVVYISHIGPGIEDNGDLKVTLDDGSQWNVSSWNASWMLEWEKGDRVIVSKDPWFMSGDHLLINFDRYMGGPAGTRHQTYRSNVRATSQK